MPNFRSVYMTGAQPVPKPSGGEDVTVRCRVPVPASLALNDNLEFIELPSDCVPVMAVLDSTDIDNATAIVMSAGMLTADRQNISTAPADGGAAWLTGSTIGQAGAAVSQPTVPAMWRVTPTPTPRTVGARITTAAGTPVAGTVTLTLTYRAARYGH
jgi:hypothetical protein